MNFNERKNWETKSKYVNNIIDFLIKSTDKLDVSKIMFCKQVIFSVSYIDKHSYNKMINNISFKYKKQYL